MSALRLGETDSASAVFEPGLCCSFRLHLAHTFFQLFWGQDQEVSFRRAWDRNMGMSEMSLCSNCQLWQCGVSPCLTACTLSGLRRSPCFPVLLTSDPSALRRPTMPWRPCQLSWPFCPVLYKVPSAWGWFSFTWEGGRGVLFPSFSLQVDFSGISFNCCTAHLPAFTQYLPCT